MLGERPVLVLDIPAQSSQKRIQVVQMPLEIEPVGSSRMQLLVPDRALVSLEVKQGQSPAVWVAHDGKARQMAEMVRDNPVVPEPGFLHLAGSPHRRRAAFRDVDKDGRLEVNHSTSPSSANL